VGELNIPTKEYIMTQLQIATWNLDHPFSKKSKRIRESMYTTLQECAAGIDILVLTETDERFRPVGYTKISATTPREDSDENERWTMIWAKTDSISEKPVDIETFDTSRTTCSVLGLRGNKLIVYGTVLPWLGSTWCGFDSTISFYKALKMQAYEWRLFQREESLPLIVAGDFNQDLWNKHYYGSSKNKELLKESLGWCDLDWGKDEDPVAELTAKENRVCVKEDEQHAAIDHICVSEQFEIVKKECWRRTNDSGNQLTDHFGSLIEAELITS